MPLTCKRNPTGGYQRTHFLENKLNSIKSYAMEIDKSRKTGDDVNVDQDIGADEHLDKGDLFGKAMQMDKDDDQENPPVNDESYSNAHIFPPKRHLKTRIGQIPRAYAKRGGRRTQKIAEDMMDVDEADDEVDEEDDTPQLKPDGLNTERHIADLLKEASTLLKPGSYTSSDLNSVEASLILAGVLELSQEECSSFLANTHDEFAEGFRAMGKKKMMKHKDGKYIKSPDHKFSRNKY